MDDTVNASELNTIECTDCISAMNSRPAGSVHLAFADPPFNIGYSYDVYDDSLEHEHYIAWSRDWISAVHRLLSPTGAFWLAIGDEYAAELKLESQKIGFHCRSWVIWYYTFGVNCARKFTRSHAHLFHFVKDPKNFTFLENDPNNRIPSARQLVYNDKRANPVGRLPDDTWIIRPARVVGELLSDDLWNPNELGPPQDPDQTWTLRPQDLSECFQAEEDTWYFPRVAGTFKERAGFHGCQMPEQLLGRIIRTCSNEGDIVLDPFSGSATTLAVAKKMGRKFLGFDISEEYVRYGKMRLDAIRVGDPLDGSAEPLLTAPKTKKSYQQGSSLRARSGGIVESQAKVNSGARETSQQLRLTLEGVVTAFQRTHGGYSADRVVVDPELNGQFVQACQELGLVGEARTWNRLLFRLRKAGNLAPFPTTRSTAIPWEQCDHYLFASEIALQELLVTDQAASLDEILCDPFLAAEFDKMAQRYAPGYSSLQYRWAALQLRKQAKLARSRSTALIPPSRLGKTIPLDDLDVRSMPEKPGVYLLSEGSSKRLYAGEALNLNRRFANQFGGERQAIWSRSYPRLGVQYFLTEMQPAQMLTWQCCLVQKYNPTLNFRELRSAP